VRTTDVVVVGAGVRPRSRLAEDAGLELGAKKAIRVDRRQRTSHAGIWSAGDCAEAWHLLLNRNAYVPLALTANRAGARGRSRYVRPARRVSPGIVGTPSARFST
jgi:NADPH-dependent 2,4-dienoyl-CoA reductase/sulfur reductase-like enzyme